METKTITKTAYVITAVDISDTADGRARTLGVYFDRDEAYMALVADMKYVAGQHGPNYILDEGEMTLMEKDGDNGCLWNIEDVEMKVPMFDATSDNGKEGK